MNCRIARNTTLVLVMILGVMTPGTGCAQDDADFRMEIGGALGSCFYLGDANTAFYKGQRAAAGVLWRYLFDHHNVLKASLTTGGIKGTVTPEMDFYPQNPQAGVADPTPNAYRFSGSVTDLSCLYELNFWPYGYYNDFQGHKRLTPFLQLGLGLSYGSAGKDVSANIPLGVGVKYRLGKRVNVALDWTMHFSLSDKLDNYANPQGIKSEGWKNKDSYCMTLLTLTYSFAPICQTCNKAY